MNRRTLLQNASVVAVEPRRNRQSQQSTSHGLRMLFLQCLGHEAAFQPYLRRIASFGAASTPPVGLSGFGTSVPPTTDRHPAFQAQGSLREQLPI